MASINLKGWFPVDAVVVDGQPGLSWLDLAGVDFTEPFFQQTVDRAKQQDPARQERFIEFHELVQIENTFDSVAPTGFIFHSSRCGSTLLANACRALADTIVLSEPPAVDKLVARLITDTWDHSGKEWVYSMFLRVVVKALAQRRSGHERNLFLKFSCCSVSRIGSIRRIWPNVPWVFLYRDPIETIVSNVENRPAWMLDEDRRVLASIIGSSSWAVAEMSPEELCARAIGSFYSTAQLVANDHALLLNYNQLSPAEISNVLKFFGVTPAATEMEAIARQSQTYSKSASGPRAFAGDSAAKQSAATDRIREMAEAWAMKPYQLLEQKRVEMNSHVRN